VLDRFRALVGLSPYYIKLAGVPGENALMTKAGAEASYQAMLDGPSRWENKIAARLINSMPLYRPITRARAIAAPLLMVVCDRDEVCPPSSAAEVARLAPHGRAAHFDSGHFEIYFGALFDAATAQMLAFLDQTNDGAPGAEGPPAKSVSKPLASAGAL
jgi:pimeloyl-ACP methyl ester carboxylesterase